MRENIQPTHGLVPDPAPAAAPESSPTELEIVDVAKPNSIAVYIELLGEHQPGIDAWQIRIWSAGEQRMIRQGYPEDMRSLIRIFAQHIPEECRTIAGALKSAQTPRNDAV